MIQKFQSGSGQPQPIQSMGQRLQTGLKTAGDVMAGGLNRAVQAGPASFNSITGGPATEFAHGVKLEALKRSPVPEYPIGEVGIGGGNLHEAIAGATDANQLLSAGPFVASGISRGTDKNITSLLKRLSGQEGTDIKQLRALEAKRGQGFVLDKTKSKPEYLGREISPKAAELASSRVRSMEPDAMREIGIGSEDTALAQELKAKFGLKEFPTKSSAEDFFANTIDSVPDDIQINTANLERAFSDPANKLDKDTHRLVKDILDRRNFNEIGGLDKTPMSKQEFQQVRAMLNNLDPKGEIPGVQAIKQSLDSGLSDILPQFAEAKGLFQLSHQVPKAELYLDKTKLDKEMSGMLNTASEAKNVNARESLSRLLGQEGEGLIDDSVAQRISKEMYAPSNLSTRPVGTGKSILDFVRIPGRFVQRGYEKMRSGVMSPKGSMVAPRQTPIPTSPQAPSPIKATKAPANIQEILQRVYGQEPSPITPVSEQAMMTSQQAAVREAIARGEMPYAGGAGNYAGPEVFTKAPTPNPIPYKGGAGNYQGPAFAPPTEPMNPLPYKSPGGAAPFKPTRLSDNPYGDKLPYKSPNLKELAKKMSRHRRKK